MKRIPTTKKKQILVNEQVRAWTASHDGMKAIQNALCQATTTHEQLQAARMVDPQKLRIPLNL